MSIRVEKKDTFVLDTSAVIAYLANEKGAAEITKVKERSSMPFIVLSELYYVIWQKRSKADADNIYGLVKSWHLPILIPGERVILIAGRFKALYKLGIADSYIAAFTFDSESTLITKDRDYNILKDEIKLFQL